MAPVGMGPRKVAVVVWAVTVALLLLFLAVVLAVERQETFAYQRELMFWLATGSSALGIILSRVLPARIPVRRAEARPAVNAITRCILGWGLCAAGAVFVAVAHIMAHDARLELVFAVDVLALVLLYPGKNAWAQFAAERGRRQDG